MPTLDEIILQELNPFDPVTFKTGNFWLDLNYSLFQTVESIHQDAIKEITGILDLVAKDRHSRTAIMMGDSGCGKSYLLERLKKKLNPKAFFVYIDPCPSSDFIWRHTLRCTVDSLMRKPEGEKYTQIQLWLKNLLISNNSNLLKKILGEKKSFVQNFNAAYPVGIYQPNQFFGVLYELTKPEKYLSACQWLRGEDLDEDDLKNLGVKNVIDSEDAARGILGNFGSIINSTKPIVLCFDQVELGSTLPDGSIDISPILKVNTTIHNNYLKNFIVIISIVTDKWLTYKKSCPQSDTARISKEIELKQISLEQVEALWSTRLIPIHEKANPKPESTITPLKREDLEKAYPGGKANLRDSLTLGEELYEEYKISLSPVTPPPENEETACLKLIWQKEFKKIQENVDRIRQFSSLDLTEMLKEVMLAWRIPIIKHRFLPSKTYEPYSYIYQSSENKKIGIFWNEEPNLKSLIFAMKACATAVEKKLCDSLILLREEKLGDPKNQGYKIYKQIFKDSPINSHIFPDLNSIHYLRTFHVLANDAKSGDLFINGKKLSLEEYQALIRESQVLNGCKLLDDLKILKGDVIPPPPPLKEFISNIIYKDKILGVQALINRTKLEFPQASQGEIEGIIQKLCQEKFMSILDPNAKSIEQIVCFIPKK